MEMNMPYAEFDTDTYFTIVADNLLRDHGQNALALAESALEKMQVIGDNEGLFMWQGVQSQLIKKVQSYHIPTGVTLH